MLLPNVSMLFKNVQTRQKHIAPMAHNIYRTPTRYSFAIRTQRIYTDTLTVQEIDHVWIRIHDASVFVYHTDTIGSAARAVGIFDLLSYKYIDRVNLVDGVRPVYTVAYIEIANLVDLF